MTLTRVFFVLLRVGSWIATRFSPCLRAFAKKQRARFWQMDRFELDCIDDPIRISLKEITSQPNE
jgi:hypothetical protein